MDVLPGCPLTTTQQMLADLGYYKGPIADPPTIQSSLDTSVAIKAFANAHLLTDPVTFCTVLTNVWQNKKSSNRWLLASAVLGVAALLITLRSKRW